MVEIQVGFLQPKYFGVIYFDIFRPIHSAPAGPSLIYPQNTKSRLHDVRVDATCTHATLSRVLFVGTLSSFHTAVQSNQRCYFKDRNMSPPGPPPLTVTRENVCLNCVYTADVEVGQPEPPRMANKGQCRRWQQHVANTER